MLNNILNDSWYGEDVFHCAIDARQKALLEAGVNDDVVQDKPFES